MLSLENITHIFNRGSADAVKVLNDVTLHVDKGSFVVIVGANGSGKSTLLNIIAGSIIADRGRVKWNNRDITRYREHRRAVWVSRVFQNPLAGTVAELSVLDNFRLAAQRTHAKRLKIGTGAAFRKQVADRIASLGLGLENKLQQAIGTLSGGQRQALTLLMSVMDDARILLLDEPTAALDPRSASIVLSLAKQLSDAYRLTTILVTHNMRDALHTGDRLVQMASGKIIRDIGTNEKRSLRAEDLYKWFDE